MDKQDGARLRPVLDEAGTCRSEPELVAQLLGVVDDTNVHLPPSPQSSIRERRCFLQVAAPSRACSGRNAAACWNIPPAQTGLTVQNRRLAVISCHLVDAVRRDGRFCGSHLLALDYRGRSVWLLALGSACSSPPERLRISTRPAKRPSA
jgi:hypothetical protein